MLVRTKILLKENDTDNSFEGKKKKPNNLRNIAK